MGSDFEDCDLEINRVHSDLECGENGSRVRRLRGLGTQQEHCTLEWGQNESRFRRFCGEMRTNK